MQRKTENGWDHFTNLNSNEEYYYNVTTLDYANNKNSTVTWKMTLDATNPIKQPTAA